MLPTRILLASDGSQEAARAGRTAVEFSQKLGAELHLVYVGHMPNVFWLSRTSNGAPSSTSSANERWHEPVVQR